MKILTLNSDFSGIKTVVFYRWFTFIPTNSEVISSTDKDDLLRKHSSTEVYYYSGGDSSDYLAFSEYGFKFNPEKDKFQSFIKPNYFDTKTLSRTKINDDGSKGDFYNFEVLSLFDSYMFPGISNETTSSDEDENSLKFFGIITTKDQNILLLDIPEDVWKVELYGDFIYSNNSLSKYRKSFVSYELLKTLFPEDNNEIIIKIPTCIITMGPDIDDLNNLKIGQESTEGYSYSMYYNGNLEYYSPLSINDFIKSDEVLWNSSYREITSREILQLIISPEGSLENIINISYLSWLKSKNPNRNQKDYSLRNDEFWATRDHFDNRAKIISEDFFQDPISGTLLGTQKIDPVHQPLPILNSKIGGIGKRFFKRRSYMVGETTLINDYIYAAVSSGKLGEDPRYSQGWIELKEYEEGDEDRYLGISENSQDLLNERLDNDFYKAYVHLSNKNFGRIEPSGYLSYRKLNNITRTFKITPSAGYVLNSLSLRIDNQKEHSDLGAVKPKNDYYIYELSTSDISKINDFVEISVSFKKRQNSISLKTVSLIDKKDNFGFFLEKFTHTLLKLTDLSTPIDEGGLGININFYDAEGNNLIEKDNVITTEEITGRELINFGEVNFPIQLVLDDVNSPYRIAEIGKVLLGNTKTSLEFTHPDNMPNKFNVVFSDDKEPIELYFNVTAKRFNCQVFSDSGIDISMDGQYVLYGKPFEFQFAPQVIKKLSSIEILYGNRSITFTSIEENTSRDITIYVDGDREEEVKKRVIIGKISNNNFIYTVRIDSVLEELCVYIKSKDKK